VLDNKSVYKMDTQSFAGSSGGIQFAPGKIPKSNDPKQLFKKLGDGDKQELLNKLHEMRLKAFSTRENKADAAKPHLPQLDSNERERILEQFYDAKKKLNKL